MNITDIIAGIIGLCAAVLTAVVFPWIKTKLGAEQTAEALKWVKVAVECAEQIYKDANGATKKAYVVEAIQAKGYDLDANEIDAAIESAVLELHQSIKAEE